MAKIIGGIATSHTPTIGFSLDTNKQKDPVWAPLFVIFIMLEKLGAVIGTTNLHIYAAMRGQSLTDFQKTRNAQVLYSVAGRDEGKKDWGKE